MSMRSLLIRGVLAVAILGVLWLFTARWCSLLFDLVYTARLATLQSTPLGWNGIYLQFGASLPNLLGPTGWNGDQILEGAHILDLSGPGPDYKWVADLAVDAEGRLVLTQGERSFELGTRAGTLPADDGSIPAFAAEPGDATLLTLDRSVLSWPTPFELNFMTGATTTWRRHLYYRLLWRKASGARLALVWRLEQGWDSQNGWHAPGNEELIRVEIASVPRR